MIKCLYSKLTYTLNFQKSQRFDDQSSNMESKDTTNPSMTTSVIDESPNRKQRNFLDGEIKKRSSLQFMDKDANETIEEIELIDTSSESLQPIGNKLKLSSSSPLFVNNIETATNRVNDQFQVFKSGSIGSGYYDYCYGQQLPSENLF